MSDRFGRRYVDHPAPGVGFMAVLFVLGCALIAAIPTVLHTPPGANPPSALLVGRVLFFRVLAILCFYLWPLYSTYYTISAAGLQVRYGPWERLGLYLTPNDSRAFLR
jgi:hypothetical protein